MLHPVSSVSEALSDVCSTEESTHNRLHVKERKVRLTVKVLTSKCPFRRRTHTDKYLVSAFSQEGSSEYSPL